MTQKKKGFRREAKTYHIVWEAGDLAGLEIRAGGLTVGEMLTLGKAAAAIPEDFSGSIATVEPLLRAFAGKLTEWNLEDDAGKPVPARLAVCVASGLDGELGKPCPEHAGPDAEPCEYTGIVGQDLPFIIPVIMQWMTRVAGVDSPLPGNSNSGATALEASLQLASSSQSQRST